MKVILLRNVKGLGTAGDIVSVSDGHARNLLIPRNLAIEAKPGTVRMAEEMKRKAEAREDAMTARARELSARLKGLVCTLAAPADEGGRLYGSITESDVARAVSEAGVSVDKRQIHLAEHIKTLGDHTVPVRVAGETFEEITVRVVSG